MDNELNINEMNVNEMQELDLEAMEEISGGKSAGQKIKATGDLNVRKSPSINAKILGSIKCGATLEFLGEVKKDNRGVYWGKVRFKGATGWVSSKYAKII